MAGGSSQKTSDIRYSQVFKRILKSCATLCLTKFMCIVMAAMENTLSTCVEVEYTRGPEMAPKSR